DPDKQRDHECTRNQEDRMEAAARREEREEEGHSSTAEDHYALPLALYEHPAYSEQRGDEGKGPELEEELEGGPIDHASPDRCHPQVHRGLRVIREDRHACEALKRGLH